MFSNEDVTIGSWMLSMNVHHEDNRAICNPRCTPTSIAVWDIPKCSGLCNPTKRLKELHKIGMCSRSPTLPPDVDDRLCLSGLRLYSTFWKYMNISWDISWVLGENRFLKVPSRRHDISFDLLYPSIKSCCTSGVFLVSISITPSSVDDSTYYFTVPMNRLDIIHTTEIYEQYCNAFLCWIRKLIRDVYCN